MTTSLPWKHSRVSSNGSAVFVGGYCQPTTLVRSFGASIAGCVNLKGRSTKVINHPQKERMSCMRFIMFQAFAGCLNLTLCTDTWRCSMESCCLFIVVWSVRWSLCSQSQVFFMLVPVPNSRSTFLCLSSCPRGSQSWLDSGSYTD